jgi:NAD-dependent DNA ligase
VARDLTRTRYFRTQKKKLLAASHAYYCEARSIMTDEAFDRLYRQITRVEPALGDIVGCLKCGGGDTK